MASSSVPARTLSIPDISVLFISNNPESRGLTKSLENEGFGPVEASDAERALDILSSRRIHLILQEVGDPAGDGLRIARRLRAAGFPIPMLALTPLNPLELDQTKELWPFELILQIPIDLQILYREIRALTGPQEDPLTLDLPERFDSPNTDAPLT